MSYLLGWIFLVLAAMLNFHIITIKNDGVAITLFCVAMAAFFFLRGEVLEIKERIDDGADEGY